MAEGENIPGRLLRRLHGLYSEKLYTALHCGTGMAIFISVLANVQGTMFMQTLIDQLHSAAVGSSDNPDFLRTAACDHPGRQVFYAGRYCSQHLFITG